MKHCTTDKCPQILDSSCVFYEGASLIFSGINTNDSVEVVIQKLNLKLESIPIFNSNNYYDKTEIDILFNNVNLSNYYTKNEVDTALATKQENLGYAPENITNKSDSYTASSSTTYASTKALVYGLATKLDKGTYIGTAQDLKNDIDNLEGENVTQYDLINGLQADLDNQIAINANQDERLENLEGINYTWSPTNRTLTLYDNNGTQLSQVSLVSLDNEGTDLRYNASTLSLELYNADNELLDSIPVSSFVGSVGTQLQLNSNQLQLKDSQGNILSTVSFTVSNIQGLQTVLDSKLNKGGYEGTAGDLKTLIDSVSQSLQNETSSRVNADLLKQDKLSSYDESVLIEGGNIEGNVSLFQEYFQEQNCVLNFTPIQIIGVYVNGIKQRPSLYTITLPKTISVTNFTSGDYIEIQYTKLKI